MCGVGVVGSGVHGDTEVGGGREDDRLTHNCDVVVVAAVCVCPADVRRKEGRWDVYVVCAEMRFFYRDKVALLPAAVGDAMLMTPQYTDVVYGCCTTYAQKVFLLFFQSQMIPFSVYHSLVCTNFCCVAL